ncbi:hypothetical protein HanRHA438_Chr04g0176781 [Helianthus annuus]|uniref:Uncharacterized protein n=1 Tax=Helianthus annuus TaxID=4232 RepID=A0A9K3J7H1_HELAN|nr:hypothetical protein HanXRQr2_Chr04g0167101 [Helianthus annuus]KAJ0588887.1 hypothetical protein HanIR_Chr04g0179881 [Helianthus annuus]KAJ0926914.1 hypothetical protein HanRHA438_Chr04g0176781 [Helianthus annuus]KAJ0931338.1 hypothetical protein HanPSC8_Chr04g0160491 [Helianthus annuus]
MAGYARSTEITRGGGVCSCYRDDSRRRRLLARRSMLVHFARAMEYSHGEVCSCNKVYPRDEVSSCNKVYPRVKVCSCNKVYPRDEVSSCNKVYPAPCNLLLKTELECRAADFDTVILRHAHVNCRNFSQTSVQVFAGVVLQHGCLRTTCILLYHF